MRSSIILGALFGAMVLCGAARAAEDLDAPKADPKHHKVRSKAGEARYRPAFSHSVENLDDGHSSIIVDIKAAPPAK